MRASRSHPNSLAHACAVESHHYIYIYIYAHFTYKREYIP